MSICTIIATYTQNRKYIDIKLNLCRKTFTVLAIYV